MRRKLIAGNWKMHKLPSQTGAWLDELASGMGAEDFGCDLLVNVPATHLPVMARHLQENGARVGLGGQDLSAHDEGAYTGEVSGAMLADAGASHVIVGHSERRAYHGEDDELVAHKVAAARRHGLVPILCIGETEGERDAGQALEVVLGQLRRALHGIELTGADDLVIAYEPVWAIGTGRTATSADAQEMSEGIRGALQELLPDHADGIRILYGGSMKPGNAQELLSQPDIDGGLIGGASLDVADLLAIARAA